MKHREHSLLDLYKFLLFNITIKIKIQMFLVLILSLFVSFMEFFSIASLLPFIAIFTDIDKAISNEFFYKIISFFNIHSKEQIYTFSVLTFCLIIFIAMISKVILTISKVRVLNKLNAHLVKKMFYISVKQKYYNLMNFDLTDVISILKIKSNTIATSLFSSIVDINNSFFIILLIIVGIAFLNPILTLIILLCLVIIYSIVVLSVRRSLRNVNKNIVHFETEVLKILNNSFRGIKEVIIFELQQYYYRKFAKADYLLRYELGSRTIISILPRFIIEGVAIIIVAILVWYFARNSAFIISNIAMIGTVIVGLQRLLPNFQTIYASTAYIVGTKLEIIESYNLLNQPLDYSLKTSTNQNFNNFKLLEFRNVSFKYNENDNFILNKINFKIKQGQKIAVIGHSGVGKSCLLDLMIGFLKPNEGLIKINGELLTEINVSNWYRNVSYVPQDVFLLDSSLKENITFLESFESFDETKFKNVLQTCNLLNTVKLWKEGWFRVLGERGNNISGGQKQRVGIARALYKKSDIIFLDEATSALDSNSEIEIIKNLTINKPELTIIAITHRPELLEYFDKTYKIENKNLIEIKK